VTDRQTDRHLQSEVDKNTTKMPSSGLYSRYGWWWAGLYPYPNTTPFRPSETPTISSRIVSTQCRCVKNELVTLHQATLNRATVKRRQLTEATDNRMSFHRASSRPCVQHRNQP